MFIKQGSYLMLSLFWKLVALVVAEKNERVPILILAWDFY